MKIIKLFAVLMFVLFFCIGTVFAAENICENSTFNNIHVVKLSNHEEKTSKTEEPTFATKSDAETNPENPVTGKFVPIFPLLIAAFIAWFLFNCSKKQEKIFKL